MHGCIGTHAWGGGQLVVVLTISVSVWLVFAVMNSRRAPRISLL